MGDDKGHVWRASLEATQSALKKLKQTLAEEELLRADRYRFDKDSNHFIVARVKARIICPGTNSPIIPEAECILFKHEVLSITV